MAWGFPCGSAGKESACYAGHLGWEDPLEKGKATHSSIPAWRIPSTIQSMGSQRVGNNWETFPHYSKMAYMGGKSKGEWIYVYVKLIHFAVLISLFWN